MEYVFLIYIYVCVDMFIEVHFTNILICQFYHSCQEPTYRYDIVESWLFSVKWKEINRLILATLEYVGIF